MAQRKPWLKMWAEWVHDAKMLGLTLAETGAWWKLVTLAHECAQDGQLVKGDGTPLTISEITKCLHITSAKDRKTLEAMISKMAGLGSLHWNSNLLVVTHYSERQEMIPSESKEAVRERVRRHRESKNVTDDPLPPPTPLLDREGEGEGEGESNGRKPVTSVPALAKIATLHEQYFGIITPVLSEKFKDFVENYRGPVEWIDLAFAEAVEYKSRRWQYVEAILYRWQEKGGPHADRREPGGKKERTGADQRDIIEEARAAGWEVLGEDEPGAGDQG
jgi:DnaD/phage-associated family protein